MRERPLLFSGAMVRAILAGRKTQTRRVVKLPSAPMHLGEWQAGSIAADPAENSTMAAIPHQGCIWHSRTGQSLLCPYGQPGDRLWVRETWMDLTGTGIEHYDPVTKKRTRYAYGADSPPGSASDECRKDFGLKWRPSIHMPRAACRLVLEITDVRVERLQAISEADAVAEGARCWAKGAMNAAFHDEAASRQFAWLWTSINGQASWDANPWVWALTFRRVTP